MRVHVPFVLGGNERFRSPTRDFKNDTNARWSVVSLVQDRWNLISIISSKSLPLTSAITYGKPQVLVSGHKRTHELHRQIFFNLACPAEAPSPGSPSGYPHTSPSSTNDLPNPAIHITFLYNVSEVIPGRPR
jgi:hypothetical protein